MNQTPSIVAVLDDELPMRKALRRLLGSHGFRVVEYERGNDLLVALPAHPADCLVLDLHMPEVSGFDVLAKFAEQHVTTPVVVLTAHSGPDTASRVFALGASAFLTKPVDETALIAAIHSALLPDSPPRNKPKP
jgi:two-component system, LuxR family, response regulator FixJ